MLLLSQVCAFTAQTGRKQNGWKHPACYRFFRPMLPAKSRHGNLPLFQNRIRQSPYGGLIKLSLDIARACQPRFNSVRRHYSVRRSSALPDRRKFRYHSRNRGNAPAEHAGGNPAPARSAFPVCGRNCPGPSREGARYGQSGMGRRQAEEGSAFHRPYPGENHYLPGTKGAGETGGREAVRI